jgi:hypothetical protein
MLCCAGLFGGLYVGQQLGGPWTVIAPAAGFGAGLIGDMKFMRKMHKHPDKKAEGDEIPDSQSLPKPKHELPGSKDGASRKLITLGNKYPDPP